MIIPADSRFAAWKYVEVAKYIPDIKAVIRYQRKIDEDTREPIIMAWGDEVERYRKKCKNVGVYTSVFRTNSKDVENAPRLGSLYFDLDAEDVEHSFSDLKKLYREVSKYVSPENIRIYFTGSKGFHLEAEAIALGIDPHPRLDHTFRYIAERFRDNLDLETLDFAVYDARRMWRLPYSQHQKTGLYKVEIPKVALQSSVNRILDFAKDIDPRKRVEVQEPVFDIRSNQWYKECIAGFEEYQARKKEEAKSKRLEVFNRYGTSILDGPSQAFIKGAWRSCLSKLEAEGRKAEEGKSSNRNRTLSQQGFRMYLMYLEANLSLDEVTTRLEDIALAIGLEENETNATLRSAMRGARRKYEENPQGHIGALT